MDFIRNLKFRTKLAAIVIMMMVPIALLGAFFLQNQFESLANTRLEQTGVEYFHPTEELVSALTQYEAATNAKLAGDPSAAGEIASHAAQIKENVAHMEELTQRHGDASSREQWAQIKPLLARVTGGEARTSADIDRLTEEAETKLLALRTYISNTWGMALDPESTSYNTLSVSVDHVPDLEHQFGNLVAQAAAVAGKQKPLNSDALQEHAAMQALAEATIASITTNLASAASTAQGESLETVRRLSSTDVPTLREKLRGYVEYLDNHVMGGARDASAGDVLKQAGAIEDAIDAFHDKVTEVATAELAQRSRSEIRSLTVMSTVVLLALALALGFSWLMARMTTDSLNRVVTAIGHVADGDYTHRVEVTGSDEFGQLLRTVDTMQSKVASVLASVRYSATTVATAAGQIDAGTQDLAARTEKTAASLEETAASMEQMTSTVRQNADNAGHANQLALAAREQAEEGGKIVRKAVDAMEGISSSSRRIADIIAVVDEIAFQTNLLALNASVEAARAGDQGRGFAVVASEVRNLAQRSAKAAREIKELIQDSVTRVEAGSKLVDESGKRLAEIEASVKKVTDIIGEITAASDEQARGVEEVNRAVMDMDQGTQQNAAMVEEATAAAASMSQESRRLAEAVAYFKIAATSHDQSMFEDSASQHSQSASAAPVYGAPKARVKGFAPKPDAKRPAADRRGAARPWGGNRSGSPASASAGDDSSAGNTAPRKAVAGGEVWDEF